MDALIFGLLLSSFILIAAGHKKPAVIIFGATMALYMYWFSFHATSTLNINL